MIPSENFSFEYLEVLSIYVVLMFPPRWATFFVLQAPVYGEQGRKDLELIAGNEHLVNLRVPRVSVADEPLVVGRIIVWCDEEGFVQKLDMNKKC